MTEVEQYYRVLDNLAAVSKDCSKFTLRSTLQIKFGLTKDESIAIVTEWFKRQQPSQPND